MLNTECSAGNDILQSTAQDFGVKVEDYVKQHLAQRPCRLVMDAVFMQSDIVDFQRQGWKKKKSWLVLQMYYRKTFGCTFLKFLTYQS